MSRKLLAKLTLNSVNFSQGVFGGYPSLTWQDVSFALGGLSRVHILLAEAVYNENNNSTRQLVYAVALNFKLDSEFVNAALFEFAYPNRCRVCHGEDGLAVECENCNGTGMSRITDRQRASLMRRSREYYRARKSKFDELLVLFHELDDEIIKTISRKLNNCAA